MLSRIRKSWKIFFIPRWGSPITLTRINLVLSDNEHQLRWFKGRWILKSMCEGSGKGLSFIVWSLFQAQLHHLSLCQAFILLALPSRRKNLRSAAPYMTLWPQRTHTNAKSCRYCPPCSVALHLSCVFNSEMSVKGVFAAGACASISTIKPDSGAPLLSVRSSKSNEASRSVSLSF